MSHFVPCVFLSKTVGFFLKCVSVTASKPNTSMSEKNGAEKKITHKYNPLHQSTLNTLTAPCQRASIICVRRQHFLYVKSALVAHAEVSESKPKALI